MTTPITGLPAFGTPPDGADLLPITDASANVTKKVTVTELAYAVNTPRETKTASFAASLDVGLYLVDTTSGNVTITLPAVAKAGFTVKKINAGTNKITLARAGADNLEGANVATLDLPDSATSDRNAWRIEGQTGTGAGWWIL